MHQIISISVQFVHVQCVLFWFFYLKTRKKNNSLQDILRKILRLAWILRILLCVCKKKSIIGTCKLQMSIKSLTKHCD